jgi:hypothetical protein
MISAALLILAMTPGVNNTIYRDGFDEGLCPAGRQTRANISWAGFTITNVDVTQWQNVWGHSTAFDGPQPWPGRGDSMPTFLNFTKTGYMALAFHVPAGSPPNLYGWLTHTEYNYGQDLTASISTACGDFNSGDVLCFANTVSGQNLAPWAVPPPNSFCPLLENGYYFLNLKMTDPTRPSQTCAPASPSCVVGTANNFHQP